MRRTVWAIVLTLLASTPAHGYIDIIPSLGRIVADARAIVVLKVEKVDRDKRIVVYRVAETLLNTDQIAFPVKMRLQIGAGLHPKEPKQILDWAKPGKMAVCLIAGHVAVTCIDKDWYEASQIDDDTWTMTRGRSELGFAFLGSPETLRDDMRAILDGNEVTVPALKWAGEVSQVSAVAFKQSLRSCDRPMWRMRASLKMPSNLGEISDSPHWIVGAGIGDAGDVPALVADLQSDDANRQAAAMEKLGLIGRVARPAVPALKTFLHQADSRAELAAAAAILRIDSRQPEALLVLRKMMQVEDADIRKTAVVACGDLGRKASAFASPLVAATSDADGEVRVAAVESLGQCRDAAEIAVPALRRLLATAELRSAAIEALGVMGAGAASAAPELTALLDDPEPDIRWAAAVSLLHCDIHAAQRAIPLFVVALRSDNARTRWDAIWYFDQLPDPQVALDELIALADHGNSEVRAAALMVLGNIGENAQPAAPSVARALEDKALVVRNAAARAASLLPLHDSRSVTLASEVFAEQFRQTNPRPAEWVLWNAADFLRRLGPVEKIATPTFCNLTTDADPFVRRAALVALINLGDIPESALPAIRICCGDSEPTVQFEAARALWEISGDASQVIPIVTQAIKRGDARLREQACDLLKRIGAKASTATAVLLDEAKDREPNVRLAAAEALWAIAPQRDQVLPIFLAELDNDDDTIRIRVATGIGQIGMPSAAATQKLLHALADRDDRLRIAAATCLQPTGTYDREIVAAIRPVLDDSDETLREAACELLGRLGPSAQAAVPDLQSMLAEDEAEVRFAAAKAILRLSADHHDDAALAAVVQTLGVGPVAMRVQAIQFLGELGVAAQSTAPALRPLTDDADKQISTAATVSLAQVATTASASPAAIPQTERLADSGPSSGRRYWQWGAVAGFLILATLLMVGYRSRRPAR